MNHFSEGHGVSRRSLALVHRPWSRPEGYGQYGSARDSHVMPPPDRRGAVIVDGQKFRPTQTRANATALDRHRFSTSTACRRLNELGFDALDKGWRDFAWVGRTEVDSYLGRAWIRAYSLPGALSDGEFVSPADRWRRVGAVTAARAHDA